MRHCGKVVVVANSKCPLEQGDQRRVLFDQTTDGLATAALRRAGFTVLVRLYYVCPDCSTHMRDHRPSTPPALPTPFAPVDYTSSFYIVNLNRRFAKWWAAPQIAVSPSHLDRRFNRLEVSAE